VSHRFAKVCFGSLFHLYENHGRDFRGSEGLLTLAGHDLDVGLVLLVDDREGEEIDIGLHSLRFED